MPARRAPPSVAMTTTPEVAAGRMHGRAGAGRGAAQPPVETNDRLLGHEHDDEHDDEWNDPVQDAVEADLVAEGERERFEDHELRPEQHEPGEEEAPEGVH